jgi:hypothetical protein
MSSSTTLNYYFSPRKRLDTLFLIHSTFSIFVGVIGYIYPSSMGLIFLTETKREYFLGRAMYRPTCALILAQGLIIWKSRTINDGQIKRAFVQAYFICFFLSTCSLINEHYTNSGVVSGKFAGTLQIIFMILLTAGYAWFTFFQPPSVFQGLAMRRTAP